MFRNKFLQAAKATALSGSGAGGKAGYRLGAVIVNKKLIEVAKVNSLKTNPRLCRHFIYPHFHAESSAIFSLGLDNCYGKDLYVVRVKRDGSTAMAKPCTQCQRLIKDVGIKEVYYTTNN